MIGLSLLIAAAVQAPTAATHHPPIIVQTQPVQAPVAGAPPQTMQWLYGSGEAAAASIQAYHALRNYALAARRHRPRYSVVLAEGSTLNAARFFPCGHKPLAVVLDVDETALLNLGYEYDQAAQNRAYDPKRWSDWERTGLRAVAPVPGAVTALRAVRNGGVAVIFNTNRSAENAAYSEAALNSAGLGPVEHLRNLFLQGDAPGGSAKDQRRALIASRYCVVAMAGDQLGDFSDLFNANAASVPDRRRAASSGVFAQMWGNGWFVLPNPVYGTGVKGTFDETFPADKRWSDPVGGQ